MEHAQQVAPGVAHCSSATGTGKTVTRRSWQVTAAVYKVTCRWSSPNHRETEKNCGLFDRRSTRLDLFFDEADARSATAAGARRARSHANRSVVPAERTNVHRPHILGSTSGKSTRPSRPLEQLVTCNASTDERLLIWNEDSAAHAGTGMISIRSPSATTERRNDHDVIRTFHCSHLAGDGLSSRTS